MTWEAHGILIQTCNNIRAPLNPQYPAVQCDMVVFCLPPLGIRIKLVVGSPSLVLVGQTFLGGDIRFTVNPGNPSCPLFKVRMDEDREAVRRIPQDVVRTAPYKNTGLPGRQFQDDIPLYDPQIVLVGHPGKGAAGKCICQPALVGAGFLLLLYIILGKPAVLCQLFNQLLVITGNAQFLGGLFPDCPSPAAEFPADCYDSVLHFVPSRSDLRCDRCSK